MSGGKQGLGFGVGKEPLSALFASFDIQITATDLDQTAASEKGWVESNQHSSQLSDLNSSGICENETFAKNCRFLGVDMNAIPPDLNGYDFCWSACSLEHLGSIANGLKFIESSLNTLDPGGIAVHTTELNLFSDFDTIDNENTVLFRRRDLIMLIEQLSNKGHDVEPLLIHGGSAPIDNFIDVAPYQPAPHLRLQIGRYNSTSVGLIIRKK